jgi:arylformamidase
MPIYKQYNQAALNSQYNNRLHVPDFTTHLERWELLSRQTEKEFASIKDIAYGKLPLEQLDVYPSQQPSSKTLIFIHGGYWYKMDKASFQFIAKAFGDYGITTVLINYPLVPAVSIDQVSASCRKAVCWVHQNITEFNGNPDEIYIAGHSAGGHLAAMLLTTDWKDFNLTTDVIKGVCAVSGLFNLIPIQLSDINQVLNMDTETALRNSPVTLLPATQCPLAVVVGADETAEFLDQSAALYTCWKESTPAEIIQIQGLNHYTRIETMLYPECPLHQVMLRVMKI